MKESINLKWSENMVFEGEVDNYKITVDAKPEHGGTYKGPRPKPLLMLSLAGCTAMDVISILKKMRVDISDFNVRVEGDLKEEHPKQFTAIHLIYEFKGKDLQMSKLEKAVELSQTTYCGVSATLRKAINITYEIKVL